MNPDRGIERVDTDAPSTRVPLSSAVAGDALTIATQVALGTMRCGGVGVARVRALAERKHPTILVGWHGDDFLSLALFLHLFGAESRGAIMVPATRRGLSLLRFGRRLGFDVVVLPESDAPSIELHRGIATMARLVREGRVGLIALDGPSGPEKSAKPGALMIARRAGAVLVPTAAAATPAFTMRWRWDRHRVPLPFAKAVAYYGQSIDPREHPRTPHGEHALVERLARDLERAAARSRALCMIKRAR